MKAGPKIKEFFKNHKLLFTVIIIYIMVYILNYCLPPFKDFSEYSETSGWAGSLLTEKARECCESSANHMNIESSLIKMIPAGFLYYGIADIISAVGCGIFASLAIIIYAECLLGILIKKLLAGSPVTLKNPEKAVIRFMITNIMFYPLSIIMKHTEPLLMKCPDLIREKLIDGLKDMSMLARVLGIAGVVAAVVLAAIVVIVPSLAEDLWIVIYITGFALGGKLIILINNSLADSMGEGSAGCVIIVLLLYLLVMTGLNYIFGITSEKLRSLWFSLLKGAGSKIKNITVKKKESGS